MSNESCNSCGPCPAGRFTPDTRSALRKEWDGISGIPVMGAKAWYKGLRAFNWARFFSTRQEVIS